MASSCASSPRTVGSLAPSRLPAASPTRRAPGQLENASGLDLGQPFTEPQDAGSRRGPAAADGVERPVSTARSRPRSTTTTTINRSTSASMSRAARGRDSPRPLLSGRCETGSPAHPESHQIPPLDPEHLEAHDADARPARPWKDVRALYQRENRLEARVSLESMKYDPATNTALPTLKIEAGPRILVNTIGAKISKGQLQRYIPIFEEHSVRASPCVEPRRKRFRTVRRGRSSIREIVSRTRLSLLPPSEGLVFGPSILAATMAQTVPAHFLRYLLG